MRLPTLPWFVESIREEDAAKKLGATIEFGRQAVTQVVPNASVIIVDVQRGEGVDAFARPQENANRQRAADTKRYPYPYRRGIACEALIIAVATVKGARREDHVELCDILINNFIVAANEAARRRKVIFEPSNGGAPIPEAETSAALASGFVEHGARYLLRFFLQAPIVGQPIPTVTIGPPPDVGFNTLITVPFDGTDWETEV